MADNGTAAAQAKGAAAADAVGSAPQPTDAEVKKGATEAPRTVTEPQITAGSMADAEPVGDVVLADPVIGAVGAEEVVVHPDNEGGQSFLYGHAEEARKTPKVEQNAADIANYDAAVRVENPDKVLYRKAGSSGKVGGESFDYGQKPKND